jgi:hypothetical protein
VAAEDLLDESGGAAHLFRTLDGGRTLEEIPLPSVGTLRVGSFPIPLTLFRIVAMRWSDRDHGRIVGSALVWYHKTADANPEGQTRICRVVDLQTADGGGTWSDSGLGTIAMDSANPGVPSRVTSPPRERSVPRSDP